MLLVVWTALSAASSAAGNLPIAVNSIPMGTNTIIGDKITAPRKIYKVQLASRTRLDVRVFGGLNTAGTYDVSLYLPHDGFEDFTHLTCLTRSFSDPTPQASPKVTKPTPQAAASASCRAHSLSTSNEGKSNPPKKLGNQSVKAPGSQAQINYLASKAALYYVVIEFYGAGVQLQMNAGTSVK
jgi:hypothetical protein